MTMPSLEIRATKRFKTLLFFWVALTSFCSSLLLNTRGHKIVNEKITGDGVSCLKKKGCNYILLALFC
jgi:hypothetical protein